MNVKIFLFGLFFSLHKPVARIFYGEVNPRGRRTERGGVGGGGGVIRLSETAFRMCLKTGCFSNF